MQPLIFPAPRQLPPPPHTINVDDLLRRMQRQSEGLSDLVVLPGEGDADLPVGRAN